LSTLSASTHAQRSAGFDPSTLGVKLCGQRGRILCSMNQGFERSDLRDFLNCAGEKTEIKTMNQLM
jgi:hypothetical protein